MYATNHFWRLLYRNQFPGKFCVLPNLLVIEISHCHKTAVHGHSVGPLVVLTDWRCVYALCNQYLHSGSAYTKGTLKGIDCVHPVEPTVDAAVSSP